MTGGDGFIGSHLAKTLVKRGAFVRVVDNLSRGRVENISDILNKIEFMKVDLTKEENCFDTCKGIDIVFHLAASARAAAGNYGYCANHEKAREKLGWKPKTTLDEELGKVFRWAQKVLSNETSKKWVLKSENGRHR